MGKKTGDMSQAIQIGQAATQTGLTVDAIRFYEKRRLLRRPPRTEGGFRLFSREDVENMEFIRHAQELGFSLNEVRELLVLRGDEFEACSHVRDLLRLKISDVHEKIERLQTLEQQLSAGLRKCERALRMTGESHHGGCPVLQEISRPRRNKEKA